MSDVTFALEAKSDQLNAVDLMASNRIIKVRQVDVKKSEQPVSVFFDGDNNKPWKPSKGMLRLIAGAWGKDSDAWVGRHAEIYFDASVTWAGSAVGGIRIKAMTDIAPEGYSSTLALSKQKRIPYKVALLAVKVEQYPDEAFNTKFAYMAEKMNDGTMTLQSVISQCQKTGMLTDEQHTRLEDAAPNDDGGE